MSNTANVIPISSAATVAASLSQLDTVSTADDAREQPAPQPEHDARATGAVSAAMAALAGGPGPLAHARAAAGVHVNSPASEVKPWGSPMSEAAVVRRPRVRPDTESGWGRSQSDLLPNGQKPELARVELEISEPLTVSVDVTQNPGETVTEPIVPLTVWALVTFGNGSTNVTRAIRCDYRFDVAVVASYVQVQVFIGQPDSPEPYIAPNLYNPVGPAQPPAQVSAQVARGIRGLPYVASIYLTADDVSTDVLIPSACRVLSLEAHLTEVAGATQFLQLYDQSTDVGPSGAPALEYPLGSTPYPGVILSRFLNPRGFSQGVFVVVSGTSGTYDPSGAEVHVEIEQLLL